jgi:hypothetical protein
MCSGALHIKIKNISRKRNIGFFEYYNYTSIQIKNTAPSTLEIGPSLETLSFFGSGK